MTGLHPNNLVMAIIQGIERKGADLQVSMPALGSDLNDQQIAAIANYSLQRFGNPLLSVDEQTVASLRRGGDAPWLVVAMPYVIWGGGGLLLCLIVWGLVVHRQRKREREIRAKRIALNRRFHSR